MSARFPEPHRLPAPYLEAKQAQRRAPTDYEHLLADALEAAFAAGAWELDAIVERFDAEGVRTPDGTPWSAARLETLLRELGGPA